MLEITIPAAELWDEVHETYLYGEELKLTLEHSLVSISKWETKWHKPFLSKTEHTREEIIDYVRCMSLTEVTIDQLRYITNGNIEDIKKYIADPMTATTFSGRDDKQGGHSIITSELIYYWMVALQIPFECENWPLARLMVLIRICNIKNQPAKKMKPQETISRYAALNAARKKQLGTHG